MLVDPLKRDMAAMKNQFKQVNNKIKEVSQPNANKENSNPNKSSYTWEDGLGFDPGWSTRKRVWEGGTQSVVAKSPVGVQVG